jgi:membrane-bound lytic murein transglycosylase A
MIKSLKKFLHFIRGKPSGHEMDAFIASNYMVYQSIGRENAGDVFFTGYYEPILMGSTDKSPDYRFPVYPRPSDLVDIDLSRFSSRFKGNKIIGKVTGKTVVPYDERKLIEKNKSFGARAKPLAWVNDPVDLFFLHIQGSGKIYAEDGKTINIHYHMTNGRPYRSIGKLLIDQGKIDRPEMSMQKIRAYLKKHPDELETILHYNPSYIFFKIEKDGPLGFLEVKLSPGRSIALDRRLFPLAGLAFIETQKPVIDGSGKIHEWVDFGRFVTNQDTGGAIRGPGRADLFCGNGRYAEIAAGHMKHPGRLYFLVLKPEAK